MIIDTDMLALAAQRRTRLFSALGDDVGTIVSCASGNKGYLSGYHSVAHDLSPGYMSAVVATRERAVLVVSAADAGPALEVLKDPGLLFRYGLFFFESRGDQDELNFDMPGYKDFGTALASAVSAVRVKGSQVGLDAASGPFLNEFFLSHFDADRTVDITETLASIRRIKLPQEVELIRRCTKLVEDGIGAIAARARVGMSEWDFAAMLCERMVAGGGLPRLVSVTSGPRSALADAYPTGRKIGAGELVRLDAGCFVGGFSSDMARTFVMGEPDRLISGRYGAIAAGLEEELQHIRAGALAGSVYHAAVSTVRSAGIPTYRRHHVGHGLGIGGYEHPIIAEGSRAELQAGMCLCVETPYYEIGWGGMMIEDTILVTDSGYEPITTIPRNLIIL